MGEKKKTFQMRHTANPTSASVNHRKKKRRDWSRRALLMHFLLLFLLYKVQCHVCLFLFFLLVVALVFANIHLY